jgi:peroxiredoxin
MAETSPLTIAPPFALQNAKGETRTLDALLDRGRLLLVFHRGTW